MLLRHEVIQEECRRGSYSVEIGPCVPSFLYM